MTLKYVLDDHKCVSVHSVNLNHISKTIEVFITSHNATSYLG